MERCRQPIDGISEVDRQHCLDVATALRSSTSTTSSTTEHLAEDVAHCIPAEVAWIESESATGSTECLWSRASYLVIFLAALFIAEHVIRTGDLLEPFLCSGVVRIGIRMELAREFAVCLRDFFWLAVDGTPRTA